MSSNLRFVLDANVFINAHRRYYSFDLVPSFWTTLAHESLKENVLSIDKVRDELINSDEEDKLSNWAKSEFAPRFESTDDIEVFQSYRDIMDWAVAQTQYHAYAKTEFASVADSWLIAFAKANDCILVTHEEYKADIKRKIPIPNVCRPFGVEYMNTFQMLRKLNLRLG